MSMYPTAPMLTKRVVTAIAIASGAGPAALSRKISNAIVYACILYVLPGAGAAGAC